MSDVIKLETAGAVVSEKQLKDYAKTFLAGDLSEVEIEQFIGVAKAFQLNPFKREIYCIAYGQGQYRQLQLITGYEVYLKRAERLDKLAGYETNFNGSIDRKTFQVERNKKDGGKYMKEVNGWRGDLSCTITIWRNDRKYPFKKTIYFEEFTQDNDMWNSKPRFMLEKVALSIGFRQCFPDEMGGMPYTNEELPPEEPRDITPPPKQNQQPNQNFKPKTQVQEAKVVDEVIENTPENIDNLYKDLMITFDSLKDETIDPYDLSVINKIKKAKSVNDDKLTTQYLCSIISFINNKYNKYL